jgi:hypothetical protein
LFRKDEEERRGERRRIDGALTIEKKVNAYNWFKNNVF